MRPPQSTSTVHCSSMNRPDNAGGSGRGGACLGAEDRITEHLASGALVRVLEDWCPPFPGLFLYYPSRCQKPAVLAALVGTLRLESRRK